MSGNIEKRLNEYIYNLCETEGIYVDCRFACFGDVNKFYNNNTSFVVQCEHYHVDDVKQIELLINTYLVRLWQHAYPNQSIALYIKDIVNTGNGYNVVIGGCLFYDN